MATVLQELFVGYFLVVRGRRCLLVEDMSAKVYALPNLLHIARNPWLKLSAMVACIFYTQGN